MLFVVVLLLERLVLLLLLLLLRLVRRLDDCELIDSVLDLTLGDSVFGDAASLFSVIFGELRGFLTPRLILTGVNVETLSCLGFVRSVLEASLYSMITIDFGGFSSCLNSGFLVK